MSGVEILASNEVAVEYAFNWGAFWITGCIILGICVGLAAALYYNHESNIGGVIFIIVVGLIFGLLFGFLAGDFNRNPIEYTTEYKVTISDEVSMNDFYEKYEIISQEGKIYTIRERE
jgi:uncharacterized membrane protein YeaQ/YmgE (transglycosylase-associated protein family)